MKGCVYKLYMANFCSIMQNIDAFTIKKSPWKWMRDQSDLDLRDKFLLRIITFWIVTILVYCIWNSFLYYENQPFLVTCIKSYFYDSSWRIQDRKTWRIPLESWKIFRFTDVQHGFLCQKQRPQCWKTFLPFFFRTDSSFNYGRRG